MKGVIQNIKTHHWTLGEKKNDFSTTTGKTYLFDPKEAVNARCNLDQTLKDDLRATHYKLGYKPENILTTHQATYVPWNSNLCKPSDPLVRKSNLSLNQTNHGFNNKTIYMTDYTKKEVIDT